VRWWRQALGGIPHIVMCVLDRTVVDCTQPLTWNMLSVPKGAARDRCAASALRCTKLPAQ
jgi:hypothetical protein